MKGVVACPQPRAAEVGAQVLEAGGNAFDAVLATAFAQMIVDPLNGGVGGMATAQVWAADKREHQIVEGSLRIGSRARPDMWENDYTGERTPHLSTTIFPDFRSDMGYTCICTPGTVAALGEIHRLYCTWPWRDLLQPAIRIAREGFQVGPFIQSYMRGPPAYPGEPDILARLRATEACARLYLRPDGSPPDPWELMRNPDYANTLEQLASRGPQELYKGELAEAIARDLEANGSFVTLDDLKNYRARIYSPLATTYRGYKACSNSAPHAGPLVLEGLNILEGFDVASMEHNSIDHLALLASIMLLFFEDRMKYLTDPEMAPVPLDTVFLSKAYSRRLQEEIRAGKPATKGMGSDTETHTTHLVAVDAQGNIATITHSLGPISGVVTPGLGFIHNDGMNNFEPVPGHPNSIAPGKARYSSMAPVIVFQDEQPIMALGAPGGNAIPGTLLQVISNVLDFGMTSVEAVSVPRIQAEGGRVMCEPRTRSDFCSALRQRGYNAEQEAWHHFAWPQLVRCLPDGRLDAASDPGPEAGVPMYARG